MARRRVYITNDIITNKKLHRVVIYSWNAKGSMIVNYGYIYDYMEDFREDIKFRRKYLKNYPSYAVSSEPNEIVNYKLWQYFNDGDPNHAEEIFVIYLHGIINQYKTKIDKITKTLDHIEKYGKGEVKNSISIINNIKNVQ